MTGFDFIANNWDSLTAAGLVVGGWLWKKAHHQKTESLSDQLLKLGRQVLPKLIRDGKLYDDAYVNAEIRKTILAGLGRLNIPLNKTVTVLVDKAVEHIHDELAQQLFSAHLDDFIEKQQGTADMLKAATS